MLLLIFLMLFLVMWILEGAPLPWPAPKQKPQCPGLENSEKEHDQIEKITQNYVNDSIDYETFERAIDDVLAGKKNSYGEAVYEASETRKLAHRMVGIDAAIYSSQYQNEESTEQ